MCAPHAAFLFIFSGNMQKGTKHETKYFRMGHKKKATHHPWGGFFVFHFFTFATRGGFSGPGARRFFGFWGHHLICGTAHLLQPEVISISPLLSRRHFYRFLFRSAFTLVLGN